MFQACEMCCQIVMLNDVYVDIYACDYNVCSTCYIEQVGKLRDPTRKWWLHIDFTHALIFIEYNTYSTVY